MNWRALINPMTYLAMIADAITDLWNPPTKEEIAERAAAQMGCKDPERVIYSRPERRQR